MKKQFVYTIILCAATLVGCATGNSTITSDAITTPTATPVAARTAPQIIESPIAENCFSKVEEKRLIDTVVVHYVSAIYWYDKDLQGRLSDAAKAHAESISLTPETLPQHKYDWQLCKAIFEAYEVSAHYIIDRDGSIIRLVAENDRAWHAGKSKMPNDDRESVNGFSIGIELTASHPNDDPSVKTAADAYTEAQYIALQQLIADITSRHPITSVVGHDEIAPGRKTDPGPLFQWDRVRTPDYKPLYSASIVK